MSERDDYLSVLVLSGLPVDEAVLALDNFMNIREGGDEESQELARYNMEGAVELGIVTETVATALLGLLDQ